MSGITALGPHQKDDPPAPHGQALQPLFTVGVAIILHRDHREIEGALKFSKINLVLLDIDLALGFIPGDY